MSQQRDSEHWEQWMASELEPIERQRNPFPWFEEMRQQGPIRYDEKRDAYDVFQHDEVIELITNPDRFTRHGTSFIDGAMMDRGPPEHTELRGMAEESFQPGNIRTYRDDFERRAEELLDGALDGDGEIDFFEEIAKPLPILIIADMLGVPTDQMDTFREWSAALAESPARQDPEAKRQAQERKQRALEQVTDFFAAEIEKREENPRDDLITTMLKAEQHTDFITRDHTVANCAMLLIAGNITTTTYMTNAMWTYIEEDVVDDLQEGTLDLERANQEVLRYRSPVIALKRYAKEDTEIAGMEIPEDSLVVGYIPSANRDERVFDHPDEFRPSREHTQKAIPFGKGIHYCLGAPLANMEAEIMLSKFLDRIEDAELLIDEIEPFVSSEIYGPVKLPIHVTL
ncbi:MAG: cytochrome P450 [Halovenus sp.]